MSVLQSIQQVPSLAKKIAHHPAIPYIAVGLMIVIEVVGFVAGPIIGLTITGALLIGSAVYLKKRRTTRIIAALLTVSIIAISVAALFPAYSTIIYGTATGLNALCSTYVFYKIVKKHRK